MPFQFITQTVIIQIAERGTFQFANDSGKEECRPKDCRAATFWIKEEEIKVYIKSVFPGL